MQTLISAALQFPTIVFTFLLALIALYWLLVLIRLAPLELFERDSLRDDHMASTLVSLGFAGVPATLALSFLMLIAGALSLAVELLACHALQRALHRYQPFKRRCLLGATVVVAERQNDESASATLLNEPSSTVTLHCKAGDCPQPGERRVLVKYLAKEGAYRSVLEQHYLDTRVRINKLRLQHKQHLNGYST